MKGCLVLFPFLTVLLAGPAPEPGPVAEGYTVARGQLTFDAEGQEGGRYHSRKVHQPTGASGVTIGRGYDMKLRTPEQVTADLKTAGLDQKVAEQYAKGAGLTGKEAGDFIAKSKL